MTNINANISFGDHIELAYRSFCDENWEAAALNYEMALSLDAGEWGDWHNKGVALYELGKFEQAIESLEIALQMGSTSYITWLVRGEVYSFTNRQEALKSYNKALSINPNCTEALTRLAFQYILPKHLDQEKALNYYERAITIEPDNFRACSGKVEILHKLDKHDEAVSTYDKAIQLTPNNSETWFVRGLLLETHYPEEAINSYNRALELNPKYTEALHQKGRVFYELKQYEQAILFFNQALSIQKNANTSYWNGKALSELERYDEAIIHFDKSLSLEPDNYFSLHEKGLALANSNKYEDALKCFDAAISLESEFFGAWYSKAYLQKEEGDDAKALESYNKALEIDPSSTEAWFERALIIESMDDKTPEDLITAFDDLITKCFPDDHYYPLAIYCKAGTLALVGRYGEALESYNLCIEIEPDNQDAWQEKGDVLEQLGRIDEAAVCYEKAKSILRETEDECIKLLRKLGRYDLLERGWKNLIAPNWDRYIPKISLPAINFPQDADKIKHDEIIYALARIGLAIGLKVHIGKKEQGTGVWNGESFSNLSLPQLPIEKPLKSWERDKIQQIDLIWFNNSNEAIYAFEVETTTAITTGIDRFMELLKIFPSIAKKVVLIIPLKRLNKINRLLRDSHYIGHPLYMESKLMFCKSDQIAQMYQAFTKEIDLDLEKVVRNQVRIGMREREEGSIKAWQKKSKTERPCALQV